MESPLWSRDLSRDLHFERGKAANEAGLSAGVAIPVLSGDHVVAVIEFFLTVRQPEDNLRVEVISAAAAQLGSAIHLKLTESRHGTTSNLLHAILRYSPNMIFIKDLDGRYLEVNERFLKEFRLTRAAVIGRSDREIFPREQAKAFQENDRKVLESGTEMEFEETAMHEDGMHVSIVHKFPLKDENGFCYALGGIVTDITGRVIQPKKPPR
jgi:PAS domain S-box-containing protein